MDKARRCALISFAPSGGPLSRVEEEGLDSPWTPCVLRVGGAPDSGLLQTDRDWHSRDSPPIAIFPPIAIGALS